MLNSLLRKLTILFLIGPDLTGGCPKVNCDGRERGVLTSACTQEIKYFLKFSQKKFILPTKAY